MSKRFFRRRTVLIGAAIVALSIGIVFASIPFLPATPVPHNSITTPSSIMVGAGTPSRPMFNKTILPPLAANQNFWLGVEVTGGSSSFCVINSQSYNNWVNAYYSSYYPISGCLLGPTPQESQDTLKFVPPGSGPWVVVALNSDSSPVTVSFLQA